MSRMKLRASIMFATTCTAALLLAGCSSLGLPERQANLNPGAAAAPVPAPARPAPPPDPYGLLPFVGEESEGAQTIVSNRSGAVTMVAIIEQDYHAASGLRCKRLRLAPMQGTAGTTRIHVACAEGGTWRFSRPLIRAE